MRLRRRKNLEDKTFVFTLKASPDPLHDVERVEIETNDIGENFLEGFAANGIEPESIWHSIRREYQVDANTKVDVQDVTGYGWIAEIESDDLSRVQEVAGKLSLQPLSREVLNAMYEQYSKNWQKYYNSEGEERHFSKRDWSEVEGKIKKDIVKNQIHKTKNPHMRVFGFMR